MRDGRVRLLGVDELAAGVGPAAGADDAAFCDHAVVPAVAIGQQGLLVSRQELRRAISTSTEREVEDVVRIVVVADIDPHARVCGLAFAQHGHDRVVGGHHMRSSHSLRHQLPQRFEQIAHVSAPHRLRCPRDLEPLPLEDVFQTI